MKKYFYIVVGIVFGFVMAWGGKSLVVYGADRYERLQIFSKVLNLVEQYYVEEVDFQKLIYGGVKGMLRELDPHTNFMPPELFKEFESETSGEFGGIGIEISIQSGILTVIAPIEDTPAWEAGIKPNDRIISINGTSTKGLSLVEAAQLMRGPKGSKIILGVMREGLEKPKDIAVVRGSVKIKSVKYTDLEDGYAYMRVTSFIENTSKDLEKYIEQHQKKNGPIKGLIIDLRRNPGGLLDQAIKVSDLFLDEGIIVSTIGRNKKEKEVVYAKKEGTLPNFPIIVLINESSASASEIVAGALQDNHRALVMGERSFGKGSVQSVVKLGDGSGLKLTVARYYTPSGVSIQAEGIKPDVAVENVDVQALGKALYKSDSAREKDIQGHLKGERESESAQEPNREDSSWWKDKKEPQMSAKEKLLSADYQLLEAYNYIRAWKLINNLKQNKPVPASAENK